jgi:hypothetical protein
MFTVTSLFGKRLADHLAPWMTDDLGRYSQAIGGMFDPVAELAEEEGTDGQAGYIPSWGKLLNPELCPASILPYLGQYVGVTIPPGASEAEARAAIKREAGLERGSLASIEAAIRTVLGAAPFTVQERTAADGSPSAYHFNVLVGIGKSSAALRAVIEAVKPGGVMFTILEVAGAWIQGADTWAAVAGTVTWASVKEGEY